jgi:hypothetical protein
MLQIGLNFLGKKMDLVLTSDTHAHTNFEVQEGDVLIHAGDLTHM